MRPLALAPLALALAALPLAAQGRATPAGTSARLPLTQDTYDSWRVVQQPALSPDGEWVAYTLTPVVGDGEVVVARARGERAERRLPRGYTGRPQLQPNADSSWTAPPVQWSADGRYVAFLAYAPRAEFEAARRAKKRPADMPKATLVIHDVRGSGDAATVRVAGVKSFRMPRDGGAWIAYLMEGDSAAAGAKDSTRGAAPAGAVAAATPGGTVRPVADSAGAKKRELGTTLVVRELAAGASAGRQWTVPEVTAFAVSDSGEWVGYTVAARDRARDGAYVRSLRGDAGVELPLLTGSGTYKALVFDRAARQVAFVSDRDERIDGKAAFALYHAQLAARAVPRATVAVHAGVFGKGVRVADRNVSFSRDGSTVLFGASAPAPDSIPADSLADKAVLDLWHWKDTRLQPQQRLEAARDRERAYLAAWRGELDDRAVRIADDTIPNAVVSDDGRVALATTTLPYAVEAMWGEDGTDAWVVDVVTGKRRRVAQKLPFQPQLSPGGRYVVWFRDGKWWAHDTRAGSTVDLTGRLAGVRFDQETWDTPDVPAPWGVAGWTRGDRTLLVYSRYDVWEVDPAGKGAARVVTDSVGVKRGLVFRLVNLDPEERTIDPAKPLVLRAFSDSSKVSGFWTDRLDAARPPVEIVMADAQLGMPVRARRGPTLLVTRQTVRDYPDLWVGTRLDSLTRVSEANPQQSRYAWADVELVHWTSSDGVPLQGLLYKPDDFDPSKKYPMVVYFYEQLSDNRYQYHVPTGRNVINPVVYASKGYLVFFPDIAYTTGYPGQNALHAIVPGVQALAARGYVDMQHLGIAGQSWGGYQTAYIITQTPLFRAAMAGAPVANMTSAYGGIRWESGVARAFQYEHGQSRIGGALWQYPMRFIENSPLFFADRVSTPLLIMSNDADGAVPWYQGIELFVALRRLGKEVYLVNYNGDGHNPRKRANQKDIDLRMQQFFDHHLRGAAAPEWMTKGIPFLQKGRDQLGAPASVQTQAAAEAANANPNAGTGASSQPPAPKP